jgi:chemotaxis receptor (MCP) glutamine deamidase CheD
MKHLKLTLCLLILVFSAACFSGCTSTQTYMPELNANQKVIADSITSKYGFENIEITGKKMSGSGGNHTILTVKLINGKNIPEDDNKQAVIAKPLAQQIRKALKNPNEFESYTIMFVTRTVDGSTTSEKYTGHEFKTSEL